MIKRVLFFAVGFLLAAFAVFASAETTPAATYVKYRYSSTWYGPEWENGHPTQSACQSAVSERFPTGTYVGALNSSGICEMRTPTGSWGGTLNYENFRVGCPSSGGWTLSGTTCTRPDCPEGQTRQSDGTCKSSDPCEPTKDKHTSGWVSYTGDKVATGTVCIGSCNYEQNIMLDQDDRIGTDGRKWAQVGQTGLGTSCTGSTTPSMEPDQKNKESKKPPCAATDGVMTTSTGKVLCVPEGTPDARKPDVKVKTKTETFPDNTTKQTTETTTRDPVTGATATSTSSTSTGKADGTEGQAGPVGTTTGSATSGSGNGDGDGEGCDPTLNFCGGPGTDGLYTKKDKTMASVFSQFQNTIKGSALGSASTGFFTVSTPGGSCPAWSVQVPMLNITLNAADYFCNGGILAALQGAGYVMLALATYIAFTWAFL